MILLLLLFRELHHALNLAYPGTEFYPWLFTQFPIPKGYWNDKENVKKFVRWFEKQIGITKMEDWYKVCNAQFVGYGGNNITSYYSYYYDHNNILDVGNNLLIYC